MAKVLINLSNKLDANGKSQVFVRLVISANTRLRLKTGIFVSPSWYKSTGQNKRGDDIYSIVVPKLGKLNMVEVKCAKEAKAKVDDYISRLTAIGNAFASHEDEVKSEVVTKAMRLTKENEINATSITYDKIRELLAKDEEQENEKKNLKSFFEWFELFLKERDICEGRKRGYRVLGRILSRYEKFVQLTEDASFILDVKTLDKETVEGFFDYMANEKQLSDEYPSLFEKILKQFPAELSPKHRTSTLYERGNNILVERKKSFRAFYNWLVNVKQCIPDGKIFNGVEIGRGNYGTPYYLTIEERDYIADFDLSEDMQLEQQRDIFVFQCLVGCRVNDLNMLTSANLIEKGGRMFVTYIPHKTIKEKANTVEVPLNDRARMLVEKYQGVDKRGRLFPFIADQNYNNAIKEVLSRCGLTRMVSILNPLTGEPEQRPINEVASSHMARRTFIGTLYKQVKDPNLIGKLSGHSEGSKAFARYRDIDDETNIETISKLDKKDVGVDALKKLLSSLSDDQKEALKAML